jgi:GTP cyclohydrolase III
LEYITIDGDDVGRKITACYLSNDEVGLRLISNELEAATIKVSNFLKSLGFDVIFCAADGVVASCEGVVDFSDVFAHIQELAPNSISFSAGVGSNLKDAYVALLDAKSNGKNKLCNHSRIEK